LRRGIRRCSGSRALGSGTRRSQHWDRLRVSGLHRSARLCSTCLLRSTPGLLWPTLCRLLWTAAAIQASLPPGTSLSPLLLLLLIHHARHGPISLATHCFRQRYDSRSSPCRVEFRAVVKPSRLRPVTDAPRSWLSISCDRLAMLLAIAPNVSRSGCTGGTRRPGRVYLPVMTLGHPGTPQTDYPRAK
jgi:hypothetical protein